MTHDPLMIAAFVDGELDDVAARSIASAAKDDAALAAAIARHRALNERLTAHYNPIMDQAVPGRLTALLTPSTIDESLAERRAAKQARRHFGAVQWGAMAASLVLGLAIGVALWTPTGPVTSRDGDLIASGSLDEALDTQLASKQPRDAAIRIGLTFRDRTGRFCRTFNSAALGGIGCREGGAWQLERTVGGKPAHAYRQASAGALAASAADMMTGEPFDAVAERAAQAAGWKQ